MTIPRTLPDQIADLYRRAAESERRARNRRRTGMIAQVDLQKGLYRVKLSEQAGRPYLTGWIRPRQLGAGGVKIDLVLSEGEQVDVVSESGDLTDAMIEMSAYSEDNPRANTDTPLLVTIGGSTIAVTDGTITLTTGSGHLA
jgi:phage baseplate assembly protein gpV